MDVKCLTCGEPWNVYHLQHDAIHETDLNPAEIDAWYRLPSEQRLSPQIREQFKLVGYEFGRTLVDLRRCPGCPKGLEADPEKKELRELMAELLGHDSDGLAATLEDFDV